MMQKKDIDVIDQYLRGELKEDALDAFTHKVKTDHAFAEEVEIMSTISAGFNTYGRQELKKKLRKIASKSNARKQTIKILYWSIAASVLLFIGFSGYFFLFNKKSVEHNFAFNTILPPFKNADIKYKEFNVDAEKGAVLSYQTGSIITIPKDAFVDKKGNVIKGNISIKYRELKSPEDLFIAGIPMNYDSSGHVSTMQTAGVCELQAYKDDSLININPAHEINIDYSATAETNTYNLLLFDTIAKKWRKEAADTAVVSLDNYASVVSHTNILVPRKADHVKPRFKLVFRDPSKFPEMAGYSNYSFQISDNEKNYTPSEANINWKSVSIDKDKTTGEYLVTFINPEKQITYKTNVVFEDENYPAALAIYNQKVKESATESLTENEQQLRQQANRIKDLQQCLLKNQQDSFVAATTFRTFTIRKAGIWCYARILNKPLGGNIAADFKDSNGNILNLKYVAILDKSQNTILRYTPEEFTSLKFEPTSRNILVAVTTDDNFAYMKNEDFSKLPTSGKCTVTLQLTAKKPENTKEIMDDII